LRAEEALPGPLVRHRTRSHYVVHDRDDR
jgi:hypothetical protein